jgi:GH18 family chitinase
MVLLPTFFVPRVFLSIFLYIAAQSLQLPSSNSHQGTLAINEEMYKNYINSVPNILDQYGFDGWAVSYERPDGVSLAPRLFHDVKAKLQSHGNQQSPKREYYVAISPSETHWLIPRDGTDAKKYPVNKSVDYVYLQTYKGGLKWDNSNGVDVWLKTIHFPADRLLAGVVTQERSQPISAKDWRQGRL